MSRLIKISASILVGLTLVFFGSAQRADATVLFSDSFQGTLSQWTGQHGGPTSGMVVNDPLGGGGKALTFNSLDSGGDLFTIGTFTSTTANTFTLSYDFLGRCGQSSGCGGYVGLSDAAHDGTGGSPYIWLSGDSSFPAPFTNPDTGTWQHVSFTFTVAVPVSLSLEDWVGASHSFPGSVYFRDLVLTDANGSASVPEPASLVLIGAGLAAVGVFRRKAKAA